MKEFVEKLIERLEEEAVEVFRAPTVNDEPCTGLIPTGDKDIYLSKVIEIVNQLAEEYKMGDISDGYHTFNELYHHRAVLFATICNSYKELAWKSKLHDTGDMYSGMFIVGIETPKGQATYHYDINPYWDMFKVTELPKAPKWDGHTPDEAIRRIAVLDNNQGWIPVAERLPERINPFQTSEYEVTMQFVKNGKRGIPFTSSASFDFESQKWLVKGCEVIAWRPLPEPYKPEPQKEIPTNHYTERFNRVV